MDNRIEYLDAWKRFQKAKNDIENAKHALREALEHMDRVRPNCRDDSRILDRTDFPTVASMKECVKEFYSAFTAMDQAWSSLSSGEHSGLQSPSEALKGA